LTVAAPTFKIALVFRAASIALAIVVALWLPMRQASNAVADASLPKTDGRAQTERPHESPDVAPQAIAGTARAWQAVFLHDVLASEIPSLRFLVGSDWALLSAARFHPRSSPPVRTFPLLI
jgi:hypothetical protein